MDSTMKIFSRSKPYLYLEALLPVWSGFHLHVSISMGISLTPKNILFIHWLSSLIIDPLDYAFNQINEDHILSP